MTATTKLGLELLQNGAANQTLSNETFHQLNQLVQASVVDRATTPPGSPANEALYLIIATATGSWAGKENQLAYWLTSTSAWQYVTPREGMIVHVNDEDVFYKYDGSAWAIFSAGGGVSLPVVQALSSTRNLALADINTFNVNSTTNNYTVTIPPQSSVAWTADAEIHFLPSNTGDITITGGAGVSVNGVVAGSVTLSTQNGAASLKRIASDAWWVGGSLGTLVEQRAALGLVLQTSQNDATAGSLMTVGAFGLGATATNNINNPDDALILANGWYTSAGNNFASQPYGTDTVYVLHFRGGSSAVQIAQRAQTGSGMKFRLYFGGSWGAWAEAWSSTGSNLITVDTGSVGFGTGSGGTVTQATSKATPVTLNKQTGRITMNAASLSAGASVTFTVNNSMVAATDCIICNAGSGFTNYRVETANVSSSAFNIRVTNVSAGSLSEAVTINFCVIKGAIA